MPTDRMTVAAGAGAARERKSAYCDGRRRRLSVFRHVRRKVCTWSSSDPPFWFTGISNATSLFIANEYIRGEAHIVKRDKESMMKCKKSDPTTREKQRGRCCAALARAWGISRSHLSFQQDKGVATVVKGLYVMGKGDARIQPWSLDVRRVT
jgi:hypothetical protein